MDYKAPDEIAHTLSNPSNVVITYYDETNNCFVFIRSFAPWIPFEYKKVAIGTEPAFDTENLPNKVNLAAGYNTDEGFLHLLKDTQTGNIEMYTIKDEYPPVANKVYDFSGATDIENARFFVFCPDQKVVYYATSNKIYAILYGGGETGIFSKIHSTGRRRNNHIADIQAIGISICGINITDNLQAIDNVHLFQSG